MTTTIFSEAARKTVHADTRPGALTYGHNETTNKDDKTTAPATTHTDLAAVPPWRRGAQQIADAVKEGTRGAFKGDGAPQPLTKLRYVPNATTDKDPLLACTLAHKTARSGPAVPPAPTIVGMSGSSLVPPPPTAAATPSEPTEIKLTSITAGNFIKTKVGLGTTVREEAQHSKSE